MVLLLPVLVVAMAAIVAVFFIMMMMNMATVVLPRASGQGTLRSTARIAPDPRRTQRIRREAEWGWSLSGE